jgi:uncharacterized membrane protein
MTTHRLILAGLVTATIGNALVAGVFLAFSSFVMPALARIAPTSGVSAMQAINIVVVPSLFIKLFLLTTIVSAVFLGAPAFRIAGLTAWLAVIAGVVAVAGSAGVTMWLNVPLNDALAGATPDSHATALQWADYLRDWTRANSARALASGIASALFLWATIRLVTES